MAWYWDDVKGPRQRADARPVHLRKGCGIIVPMSSHHERDIAAVRAAVITVSDSRVSATDEAGALVAQALEGRGHRVVRRDIVRDEQADIQSAVREACAAADVVVLTGGTGLARRDVTPEALAPLLDRELPGFGETFRRLSYEEVGAVGLLSRALAGSVGGAVVFALPGSPKACRLAMEKLVLPLVGHCVALLR